MKKTVSAALALLCVLAGLTGCGSKPAQKNIAFADVGWDSIRLHNAVASLIATTVFGYDSTNEVSGSSTIAHEALLKGEIEVHMEIWTDNLAVYDSDLEDGRFQEMGVNFDDNAQGLYVPRYVIEGDAERGIAPVAPNLRTVKDLKDYASVFKDSEDPSKGRIYGGLPGWEVDNIMHQKYLAYGLDENYNYFRPGTDAAMSAELIGAYDKGQPIVAYYWEPTWLLGKYDFVLLEDEPYDPALYNQGLTECPSVTITVGTSNQFAENNPDFCTFLRNYHTTSALISEALAYMQETQADYETAARWMMTTHPELLDEWLTAQQATEMKQALGMENVAKKINPLVDFPFTVPVNTEAIDNAVRGFSVRHSAGFEAVKNGLTAMVGFIRNVLNLLPWWLLVGLVFFLGRATSGNWVKGLIYAIMLFLIGMFGLWSLTLETLAIVMTGVIWSLLIGLPIGVLISGSKRANRIIRPVLDTMQTMPVFVYLIPAVMFFGMGSAPAVIATVIYAVVPVIRLTSLGIRQVDREVVEAAISFGSTRMQALFKVQIPQALPTIMTGINQTMMMAMAMVVTCSMIGAQGIGNEVLIAVNRTEISRGLINGIAVVILAVLMDRLTQGWFSKGGKQ
ncbi:glycine betaine ABC transporter substrate-binding protein [Oscillospiraceae bacterium LTW-04]|nr:glycine betaine ABC transporter substrate-binding protein [Oscillospiraceae bacterium MB24-C1]